MSRESGLHCLQTRPAPRQRAALSDLPVSNVGSRRDEQHAAVPVLIRVPRIEVVGTISHGAMPVRRRRRRLRREVRAVGIGLLTCLPITWILAGAVGSRVDLTRPSGSVEADAKGPPAAMPVVLLSLEPVSDGPDAVAGRSVEVRDQDDTSPAATIGPHESVQMPGYLLPVDGNSAEEVPHAGY
ncbi:hypothetical protein EP7_000469 [Isosphaeraceae bacterium EP7]